MQSLSGLAKKHTSAGEANNQSIGLSALVVSRWLWLGNRTFFKGG